ncbi:GIY-YIG nuclease family protein [Undibacterium sp. TJN25]|uniref:GIY-YIG nuclease family protein n=1 Tax=Undibacterium sp. TJN25 TaxID=3413056 RepID=UPI003BF2A35F
MTPHHTAYREPRPNRGVPGIVYLLANQGLRDGVYKIGSTRRSGWSKAMELNRDIHNTIPGSFVCEFEMHTRDSGGALELIFQELQYCHRGRKEQDYYELELDRAKEVIGRICATVDEDILTRHKARLDQIRHHDQQGDIEVAGDEHPSEDVTSSGVFKKAYLWMTAAVSMVALVAAAWVVTAWTDGNHLYAGNVPGRQSISGDAGAAVQNGFTGGSDARTGMLNTSAAAATQAPPAEPVMPVILPAIKASAQDKYAAILAKLSEQEKSAIGLACLTQKNSDKKNGSAAFSNCVTRQLAAFDPSQRPAGMAELNPDEKSALEYACLGDKYGKGLAAYNSCLSRQLEEFDPSTRPAGISRLSPARQHSIQSACAQDKYQNGPSAYNQCLSRQMAQIG